MHVARVTKQTNKNKQNIHACMHIMCVHFSIDYCTQQLGNGSHNHNIQRTNIQSTNIQRTAHLLGEPKPKEDTSNAPTSKQQHPPRQEATLKGRRTKGQCAQRGPPLTLAGTPKLHPWL